eukprot:NODE_87_length_21893_cov_0.496559.p7 type:complete len:361 gc:universal NODE_87_length_21893_cov_0.496559:939-2021(+)
MFSLLSPFLYKKTIRDLPPEMLLTTLFGFSLICDRQKIELNGNELTPIGFGQSISRVGDRLDLYECHATHCDGHEPTASVEFVDMFGHYSFRMDSVEPHIEVDYRQFTFKGIKCGFPTKELNDEMSNVVTICSLRNRENRNTELTKFEYQIFGGQFDTFAGGQVNWAKSRTAVEFSMQFLDAFKKSIELNSNSDYYLYNYKYGNFVVSCHLFVNSEGIQGLSETVKRDQLQSTLNVVLAESLLYNQERREVNLYSANDIYEITFLSGVYAFVGAEFKSNGIVGNALYIVTGVNEYYVIPEKYWGFEVQIDGIPIVLTSKKHKYKYGHYVFKKVDTNYVIEGENLKEKLKKYAETLQIIYQ